MRAACCGYGNVARADPKRERGEKQASTTGNVLKVLGGAFRPHLGDKLLHISNFEAHGS